MVSVRAQGSCCASGEVNTEYFKIQQQQARADLRMCVLGRNDAVSSKSHGV